MPALTLVAPGSGPTATTHVTSSQANIATSSTPYNLLAFLNVGDDPAVVRWMTLLAVGTRRRVWVRSSDAIGTLLSEVGIGTLLSEMGN